MEEMKNLRDLLKHRLEDLYSAEEQIIDALPKMIDNAGNEDLKNSLQDHLKVTEQQKSRLDKIKKILGQEADEEDKGFFASLFSGDEKHHCVAMEGLIREGEKTMNEDMEPEVLDAAIIASCQTIEHYEISGYGTAKAYALHLGLRQVAELLNQTLQEEYEADLLLTDLAIGEVNVDANDGEDQGVEGLRKMAGGRPQGEVKRSRAISTRATPKPSRNNNGRSTSKTANKSNAKNRSGNRTAGKRTASRSTSRGKASSSKGKTRGGSSRSRGR